MMAAKNKNLGLSAIPGGGMRKITFLLAVCLVLTVLAVQARASAFLDGIKDFVSLEECVFNKSGETLTLMNCKIRSDGLGEGTVGKVIIENETQNGIGSLTIEDLRSEPVQIQKLAYVGISGDFSALPVMAAVLAEAVKPGKEEAELLGALRYILSGLADFHADKCDMENIKYRLNDAGGMIQRIRAQDISVFSCGPYLAEGISGHVKGVPAFSIASISCQGASMSGLQSLLNMDLSRIARQDALTAEQISELSKCSIRDLAINEISIPPFSGGIDKIALNLEGADSRLNGNLGIAGARMPGTILEQFEIKNYPPVLEATLEDDFSFNLSPESVSTTQSAKLSCRDILDADAKITASSNYNDGKLESLDLRLTNAGLQKYIANEQKAQLLLLAAILSPKAAQDTRTFLSVPGSVMNIKAANFPDNPDIQIGLE